MFCISRRCSEGVHQSYQRIMYIKSFGTHRGVNRRDPIGTHLAQKNGDFEVHVLLQRYTI